MSLRDRSIRTKLLLHAVTVTGVALVVAGVIGVSATTRQHRKQLLDDLTIRADTVADALTASLLFRDPDAASDAIGYLDVDESVLGAQVHRLVRLDEPVDPDEPVPFASSGEPLAWTVPPPDGVTFESDRLLVARPVLDENDPSLRYGTLVIIYDLEAINRVLRMQIAMWVGVLVAALAVAWLLAFRLQRFIAAPLLQLANVARRVTEERDYSVRARKHSGDEIGDLTDAFNEMLTEIESRDEALRQSHDELEQRVRARTADLDEARKAAEAASGAKSEFLANMSHEIRTPMSAIMGFADLLLDPRLDASTRLNSIQTIRRNGEHLLGILNDILDLSKIEAGAMSVERIECSPARIVADVASLMRGRASEKGLQLVALFEGPLPRTIRTDPTRLRQILINLIGNAIKFTAGGTIRVVTRIDETETGPDAEPVLEITIVDEGIGMTAEQIEAVFTPFTQADTSTSRRFGGTGLGLAISRRLARRLGGDIVVTSAPGQGSTFTVAIAAGPLDGVPRDENVTEASLAREHLAAVERPAAGAATPRLDGVTVLLAEDGPDNRFLISYVLRSAGAMVEEAENGRIACDKALTAMGVDRPFDLILMDMQMPELDGYAAASKLRSSGYEGPIIALTAHAMADDRGRCLNAGCDDYLTKPIDRVDLLERVASRVSRPRSPE